MFEPSNMMEQSDEHPMQGSVARLGACVLQIRAVAHVTA